MPNLLTRRIPVRGRGALTGCLAALALAAACTHDRLMSPGDPRLAGGPVPQITVISPSMAMAGDTFRMNVSGRYFNPTAVVQLDGRAVPTQVMGSSTLRATIPPDLLGAGRDSAAVRVSTDVGLSQPVYLRVVNPAPVMASATPDTLRLGYTTTLRVAGTRFVQTSSIVVGGMTRPTRFVSATQLETTFADTASFPAGRYSVAVASPQPGGGVSSADSLIVVAPRPTLTAMHTSAARAWTAFPISVYGRDFVPSTQVSMAGLVLSTTYVSPTRIVASFPGRPPGTVYLRAITPSRGPSADSLPLTLRAQPASDAAPTLATIDTLHVASLAVHAPSGRLYVGGSLVLPGRVVPRIWSIDPTTAAVVDSSYLAGFAQPPGVLTASSAGWVYAATGAGVWRFSLSLAPEAIVGTPAAVNDLAVAADSPGVVAVSYGAQFNTAVALWRSPPSGGSSTPLSPSLSVPADVIESSDSTRALFGYDGVTFEHGIRRMRVDGATPTVTDVTTGAVYQPLADVVHAAGRLYASSGEVVDTETRAVLGRCPAAGAVRPDPASGQVYYLGATSIAVCDLNTFKLLGSITLPGTLSIDPPGAARPGALVRWGADGLAFFDHDRLYILQSPVVAP